MPMREKDDSEGVRWWYSTRNASRKDSNDQLLSSPGKCPGKSVEPMSVTVSLLTLTVCEVVRQPSESDGQLGEILWAMFSPELSLPAADPALQRWASRREPS